MIMPRLVARGSRSPCRSHRCCSIGSTIGTSRCQSWRSSRRQWRRSIANCPIGPPAVATPTTLLGRRLPADGAEARPEPGLRHAPIPQITLPSVKTRPEVANAVMKHAGDVKKTAGGDRMVPCRSGRRCRRETARTRPSAASPARWLTTTARGRLCGRRRSVSERGRSSAARRFRSSGSRRRKSPETRICAAAARQLRRVRASFSSGRGQRGADQRSEAI